MASRSTTSEYLPAPPGTRINGGRYGARIGVRKTGHNPGIKPNMCCAPATNGERAFGKVVASQPASATKMMKISATIGN
jgi:hypothetical protein